MVNIIKVYLLGLYIIFNIKFIFRRYKYWHNYFVGLSFFYWTQLKNVWHQKETSVLNSGAPTSITASPGAGQTPPPAPSPSSNTTAAVFTSFFFSQLLHTKLQGVHTPLLHTWRGSSLELLHSSFAMMSHPHLEWALMTPVAIYSRQLCKKCPPRQLWRRDGPSFCFCERGSGKQLKTWGKMQ